MLRKLSKIEEGIFRWHLQLRMPPGSVKPRINTNFEATEAEAHAMYGELLNEKARHRLGLPVSQPAASKRISLADACAAYEQHQRTMGRVDRYITDLIREMGYLREQLNDKTSIGAVTRDHMLEWQRQRKERVRHGKKPSNKNVNKCLSMLSGFFTYCKRTRGWITVNPAEIDKLKEVRALPKILEWSEYLKFAHAAHSERPLFGIFLEVLAESGARVDEVCTAKVGDIDVARKVWRRKVKPGRIVDFDAMEWTVWLATGRNAKEFLCVNEVGEPFTYRVVEKAFKRYRRVTNQPKLMPHYLRHARACYLLAEGMNAHRVKNFLGHTDFATTERYLEAAEQIRRSEKPGTIHKHLCQLWYKIESKEVLKGLKGSLAVWPTKPFNPPTPKDLQCKV